MALNQQAFILQITKLLKNYVLNKTSYIKWQNVETKWTRYDSVSIRN